MFDIKNYPLPYEANALEPFISEKTLTFHHGKHLGGYVNNLNDFIKETDYENMNLFDIISKSFSAGEKDKKIFNNAAQVFNHGFFFTSMIASGDKSVPDVISNAFGGADKFKLEFKSAAIGLFGSGWVWLVKNGEEFEIIQTRNAETPITSGNIPLMTLDVWEHAYYLDYQNRRADFVDAFLNNLVNWDFVIDNINKSHK